MLGGANAQRVTGEATIQALQGFVDTKERGRKFLYGPGAALPPPVRDVSCWLRLRQLLIQEPGRQQYDPGSYACRDRRIFISVSEQSLALKVCPKI